jgi:hypothetical protein
MENLLRSLGWICVLLGAAAAALFFTPGVHPRIVMLITCFGFLSSSAYTMINSRHQVNQSIINPGIIGMLLSSVPLIALLIFKFSR